MRSESGRILGRAQRVLLRGLRPHRRDLPLQHQHAAALPWLPERERVVPEGRSAFCLKHLAGLEPASSWVIKPGLNQLSYRCSEFEYTPEGTRTACLQPRLARWLALYQLSYRCVLQRVGFERHVLRLIQPVLGLDTTELPLRVFKLLDLLSRGRRPSTCWTRFRSVVGTIPIAMVAPFHGGSGSSTRT